MDNTVETSEEKHTKRCRGLSWCCQSDYHLNTGIKRILLPLKEPQIYCCHLKMVKNHCSFKVELETVLGCDLLSSTNEETARQVSSDRIYQMELQTEYLKWFSVCVIEVYTLASWNYEHPSMLSISLCRDTRPTFYLTLKSGTIRTYPGNRQWCYTSLGFPIYPLGSQCILRFPYISFGFPIYH